MKVKFLPIFTVVCTVLISPLQAEVKNNDLKLINRLKNDQSVSSFSNKYLNIFESVTMFDNHMLAEQITPSELSKFEGFLSELISLSRFGILSQGEVHEMFKSAGGEERYRKFYHNLIPQTLAKMKESGQMIHFVEGDY